MSKPKSEYTIQTVSNALRLLEVFEDEPELGVSELSRRLDLHKNNVFRLLATLELGGFVEQNGDTERYRLAVRCLHLGRAYVRSHTLNERSRPFLQSLAASLGETAHLAVLNTASGDGHPSAAAGHGWSVAHLEAVVPDHLLVTGSRAGRELPVHATALGKVLIGCADAETRERFDREVASAELVGRTSATLVDRHKLNEELHLVAGQGYAVDLGECAEGLHCGAVPVLAEDGALVAALSVSGPAVRLAPDVLHNEVVPQLAKAGAELSQAMGYQA